MVESVFTELTGDNPGVHRRFHEGIKVHMVGIGGISMSGLSEILLHHGVKITGSDFSQSDITKELQKKGVLVYPDHSGSNITDQDLVVYTAAVSQDNPELVEARRKGIPVIERADLLGFIMDQYAKAIAISGTHGKTTTTSMISAITIEAGLDPTIQVGGILDIIGGNTRIGSGDYFVAEACEYKGSFLKFRPSVAIVLNIEADHLDYYKDVNHIRSAFEDFLSNVRYPGSIILNKDDPQTRTLAKSLTRPFITYGINEQDVDFEARNITYVNGCAEFTVFHKKSEWGKIKLSVPGQHNVSNAMAAIAASHVMGISHTAVRKGLERFRGTHRRQENKGTPHGVRIMDDYAHHPTEIQATLSAVRALTSGKLICVFQPHTYTRTHELLDDFARSFAQADTVVVTDIYAAREKDTGLIHSRTLTDRINTQTGNALYLSDFSDITAFLTEHASPGDLVITLGAGNVYKICDLLIEALNEDYVRVPAEAPA